MLQLVLKAKRVINSIAFLFGTGKDPGNPKQVGHKLSLGISVSRT
jgi:hypothetical protein